MELHCIFFLPYIFRGSGRTMYSPSKYSRVNSNVSQGSGMAPGSSTRPPGSKSKRVQVWARIRPTASFAHDNLELLQDGRVGLYSETVCHDARYMYIHIQSKPQKIGSSLDSDQAQHFMVPDLVATVCKGYQQTSAGR